MPQTSTHLRPCPIPILTVLVLQAPRKDAAGTPTRQPESSPIPAVSQLLQQQQQAQQQLLQQQQPQQSDLGGEDVHMMGTTPTGSSAMDRLAALTAKCASTQQVSVKQAVSDARPCTAFLPVKLAMFVSSLPQLTPPTLSSFMH